MWGVMLLDLHMTHILNRHTNRRTRAKPKCPLLFQGSDVLATHALKKLVLLTYDLNF